MVALLVSAVFASSLFVNPLALGYYYPILGPVVLRLSDDPTVKDAAAMLAANIKGAKTISVVHPSQLEIIEWKAAGEIFYVGHGNEEGVIAGGFLVPWAALSWLVNHSHAPPTSSLSVIRLKLGRIRLL